MFVFNPDPYLLPDFKISPFRTIDISINNKLPDSNFIDEYFKTRFGNRDYTYTINGREALNIALAYYNLGKKDVVTIFSTSGNFYISGCVTKEIEKFCNWSREIVPETKVILVNHEFGYPFTDWSRVKEYGLPIIEDCAHSFFSKDEENTIGNEGDFAIYSFPKMFPLQIGGLLVSNINSANTTDSRITSEELRYVKNVLSYYINDRDNIIEDRISNYYYLENKFSNLGFQERFNPEKGVVPGVFMFRTEKRDLDLPGLKKYFWAHGVQCSVFYGEDTFFIPVHQALNEIDMDFFYEVMRSFIK